MPGDIERKIQKRGSLRIKEKVAPLMVATSFSLVACQAISPPLERETRQQPTPVVWLKKPPAIPIRESMYSQGAWEVIFPIERDSFGGESYRQFLGNPERMVRAWTVKESLYRPWFDLETLKSIKDAPDDFLPRWSYYEAYSNSLLDTPQIIQALGRDETAIILDSGGQHSLGMAYELAREGGWQPVPMLQETPCSDCGFGGADELVAVALYSAAEMEVITSGLSPEAPPVFIWNSHRDSLPLPGQIDNSYHYQVSDMPSPEFLKEEGITKILYVHEGHDSSLSPWQDQGDDSDWAEILKNYQSAGLEIYSLGIPPFL